MQAFASRLAKTQVELPTLNQHFDMQPMRLRAGAGSTAERLSFFCCAALVALACIDPSDRELRTRGRAPARVKVKGKVGIRDFSMRRLQHGMWLGQSARLSEGSCS